MEKTVEQRTLENYHEVRAQNRIFTDPDLRDKLPIIMEKVKKAADPQKEMEFLAEASTKEILEWLRKQTIKKAPAKKPVRKASAKK
jgi:hypothetical protein